MKNPWLFLPEPRPQSRIRLFCFHHAGGSASAYYTWARRLPQTVELVAIQLPGRGTRIAEPLLSGVGEILDAVGSALEPLLDKPFALFGHSLGGLVAFELARRLESKGRRPMHLFVSGVRAAPLFHQTATRAYSQMTDAELVEDMRALGGTPALMLENEELLELFLPILRGDFSVIDDYRYEAGAALTCPVTALAGLGDPETSKDSVGAWGGLTAGKFEQRWYPGDHFFIQAEEASVVSDLSGYLV